MVRTVVRLVKPVKTVVREETQESRVVEAAGVLLVAEGIGELLHCLLYTSDAADE